MVCSHETPSFDVPLAYPPRLRVHTGADDTGRDSCEYTVVLQADRVGRKSSFNKG